MVAFMVSRIFLVISILSIMACGSDTSEEAVSFSPESLARQNTSQMCVEYTPSSQVEQDQLQSQDWYPGTCSRSNYLGVCEQQYEGSSFLVSVVYYQDDTGLLTAEMLGQNCSVLQGNFIEGDLDTSNDVSRTFIIQENSIACTEYIGETQASHYQIELSGGIEGMCSRGLSLGICEKPDTGIGFRSNTIYYPDDAGQITIESLVMGCEHLNGTFIVGPGGITPTPGPILDPVIDPVLDPVIDPVSDPVIDPVLDPVIDPVLDPVIDPVSDVTAPVISEVTAVGRTFDLTPTYTFSSTEAGRIIWVQGSCNSETMLVVAGENVIELSVLTAGEYSNCEFTVTDDSGNRSGSLILSHFTVVTHDSDFDGFADFVELEYETDPLDATSNPMDILTNAVDFTDDNDSDGFSDELEAWYHTDPNHADSKPVDLNGDLVPDDFDANHDTDAPRLLGFDIVESVIDIQTGNEAVTFNLTVVDDISGIERVEVYLVSPSGQFVASVLSGESFTGLTHGISMQSRALGEFSEAGTWTIGRVFVIDGTGNHRTYRLEQLETLGSSTQVVVNNAASDSQAPEISAFNLVESELTIETGMEMLTFDLTVTDDTSGISWAEVILRSPSGQTVVAGLYGGSLGELAHSLSLRSAAFGKFAEAGIWSIYYATVGDLAGNTRSYWPDELNVLTDSTQIIINNASSDTQAAEISAFNIIENEITIETGLEMVTFDLTVTDDISGIDYVHVSLRSPSGLLIGATSYGQSLGGLTHTLSMESHAFGEFSEEGTWSIDSVSIYDMAGNYNSYSLMKLETLGFDTSVTVNN